MKKTPIKKITAMLLALTILPAAFSLPASAQEAAGKEISVSAKSAVLIDADSGKILYAKNETEKLAMASTTKIMTALIALEAAAIRNPVVTVTEQMTQVEGSSMGILPGNQLTLRDLAVGMLTVSGNDAANAVAISVAGSAQAFAERMNLRARELGMENTHFVTPSGLDADGHYSTAYDMALLGAAAMKNQDFASIVSQQRNTVKFIRPERTVRYTNHNRLLSLYEGCNGIKTGFTKKAGRCLVSSAERDGLRLVAVTLNAPDDWDDHVKILDYGFSLLVSFQPDDNGLSLSLPVAGGEIDSVPLTVEKAERIVISADDAMKLKRTVELPRFTYAPVRSGQLLGAVRYSLDGELALEVPIVAANDVARSIPPKSRLQKILDGIRSLFS